MMLKPVSKRNLKRLRVLLDNPSFVDWYYHEFFTLGFIPVPRGDAEKDIATYRKALDEVLGA